MWLLKKPINVDLDRDLPHNETEVTAAHVQGHAHKELNALVADLVQGRDLLAETASIETCPGLPRYYLHTAMPISTGRERERKNSI